MKTRNNKVQSHTQKEPNLKGTLVSVSFLGLFIVASWIVVFVLFLSR
ncbi:cytochrome c oxidase subunit 2A [Oceanobacillus salinisoli]|nr:cytochrome c oxidase subunit 2A [Oceanobacillus salinisoli]